MPSKVRSRYGGFMRLTEKKERGSPAPLQREKNLEIKRESIIVIVRLLSTRAFMVGFGTTKLTRVWEPALLWNQ